jgi:hypothetical protein
MTPKHLCAMRVFLAKNETFTLPVPRLKEIINVTTLVDGIFGNRDSALAKNVQRTVTTAGG